VILPRNSANGFAGFLRSKLHTTDYHELLACPDVHVVYVAVPQERIIGSIGAGVLLGLH